MKYTQINELEKKVSRIVIGSRTLRSADTPCPHALLDHYFECGGNAIDTAFVYGTEEVVGKWFALRKNREDMVLISKGAHTPHCTPAGITEQLPVSLERLQSDYVDIYLMHRDNPQVPAGEFIDCLNEQQRGGRLRIFGVSNWTIDRIKQANEYADANGLNGITLSSPHFSLPIWNKPMWSNCIAPQTQRHERGMARHRCRCWHGPARPVVLSAADFKPEDRDDPTIAKIVDTWFNEDNFRRVARASELAKSKGSSPLKIALAYVLCQPLNIFAVIGPCTIDETAESLEALDVELSPAELRWLNLEQ